MEPGIKELGSTFIVGAFTILGLELILYYFFEKTLTGFFQGRLGLQIRHGFRQRTEHRSRAQVRQDAHRPYYSIFNSLHEHVGLRAGGWRV